MQGRLSLQERLLLLAVAAVMPMAALSILFTVRDVRSARALAQSQLKFAALLVAAHHDRTVESAQVLLGAISTTPSMRSPEPDGCNTYFGALRDRYPVYANIGLLDSQGKLVCHANWRAADFSMGDVACMMKSVSEGRFTACPAGTGYAGRSVFPFAQPVSDADGTVSGVVFARLDLARAAGALGTIELPAGSRVTLSDRQGNRLMQHPAGTTAGASRAANPAVVRAAQGLEVLTGEWDDPDAGRRLYAVAPGRRAGGEGFVAEVSIDEAQVAQLVPPPLVNGIALLIASLGLGALAAWVVGARFIAKPAKQILGAVRRLEQGRLDARVPVHPGHQRGEFARIGAAFNLMAESLQLRQIDLETELGRSRGAYGVLALVLNSMQEGLVAVTSTGKFMMFNEAAARLFPLDGPAPPPQDWATQLGFFRADGVTPYRLEELPLVRSALGESGRQQLLFVRNALVPDGRLLQCSWQPIRGDDGINGGLVVFTDVTELQRLQAGQAAQFAQLQETQRRLMEAHRVGRIGNWEIDLANGRLWWSDEVYGLYGLSREQADLTVAGFSKWVHPDDLPLLKPARDLALRDGQPMDVEYRVVKPDGTVAWFHEIGEARRNSHGEPVWFGGVVQDVTTRKKHEQALQERERELQGYALMLQRAAGAAQAITAHASLEGMLQEVADQARRVIGARRAAVSLAGASPDEPGVRSLSGDDFVSGDLALTVLLAGRNGELMGQLQLTGKDTGPFTQHDAYVAMELAQLASIAIENARLFTQVRELNAGLEARISERTLELTRQEQLYRTLAEQAPEVVWNADASGSHLTFLNRAWYDLVGGTPADWIGQSGIAAIHPEDRESVAANWRRAMHSPGTFTGVRRLRGKNGSYHTMSYKAAPVLDDQGQVAFWVGIDADITELKAIEQALRSSNQELEAFSYSVSHDLRAPLGAIGGFGQALALKLEGHADDRVRHYLARIQAGVEKMEQLIDSLLSLSKVVRAPLSFGPVDLGALARETLDGLRMQQPEREVAVQVADALEAHGDAQLLRLVMQNLLGNAWKFTSRTQGASIQVGRIDHTNVFFVRDNGVGFDMAYAGKLFGAFQRLHTEAEFPGTGIGLATVRRVVARHQGRVWAESEPGRGTTFFFVLSESPPPAWLTAQGTA